MERKFAARTARRGRVAAGAAAIAIFASVLLDGSGGDAVRPVQAAGPTFDGAGCRGGGTISGIEPDELDEWHDLVLPPMQSCFHLNPRKYDERGIAPDTDFVLRSSRDFSAAELAHRLSADPPVPLAVTDMAAAGDSQSRYRVSPARALDEGRVYRIALAGSTGVPAARWAFQVATPLRVVQTLPRNHADHAPLNIGIELTFSHDGVIGVEERFRIDPPVEGRFETHGRVVVFVPLDPLARRTIYTVTLAPGARVEGSDERIEEEYRFRFESGLGKRYGRTPGPRVRFERVAWEAPTTSPPALGLFGTGGRRPERLSVAVYRYPSPYAFMRALDARAAVPSWADLATSTFRFDRDSLPIQTRFEAPLRKLGRYGQLYIEFPDRLDAGYYVVEAADRSGIIHALLQVTDVATYSALSGRRTIVWVNDLRAREAIVGAEVRAAGRAFRRRTGADGVASFRTPEWFLKLRPSDYGETISEPVRNLLVTAPDGRTAVVPMSDIFGDFYSYEYREYTFQGEPGGYWRYLYADRPLYRPTDTINFWGLIRSRLHRARTQRLTVQLSGWEGGRTALARADVSTTPTGTFIGSMSFRGVEPGWYSVDAMVGDQVIASTGVEIKGFVRPAYQFDLDPRLRAIFAGERAVFDLQASFFEGTPVAGTKLRYRVNYRREGSAVTDARGHATIGFEARSSYGGGPSENQLWVRPALEEEGDIDAEAWVRVFPSSLTMTAAAVSVGSEATVRGAVHEVDLTELNAPGADYYADYRGSPAQGLPVRAAITEEWYTKVRDGVTYDFIAKASRPTYHYERHTRSLGTREVRTGARGRYHFSFSMMKGRFYEVTLRVTDDRGRAFTADAWASRHRPFDYGPRRPYLVIPDEHDYAVGDRVVVAMRTGTHASPSGGANRYLFYEAQNGILGHSVRRGPRYRFAFEARHIPNVSIVGVRFTGETYEEASYAVSARFDRQLRALRIRVRPQRVRYSPGDRAVLDVRVTDRAGRPVVAEVLLGAVDEALYRVQGASFYEDLGILDSLYREVGPGILRVYASHQYPRPNTGAENGGEGGARSDFRDVALFDRLVTARNGRASIAFDLPDNLTSWRVTALAVTEDLFAGTSVAWVRVGLPMFVDVSLNDTYLVRDQPSIRVRAYGDALREGDAITFTVRVATLAREEIVVRGRAFDPVAVPLPPLRVGAHRLVVGARSGERRDAVARRFTVVRTRLLRMEVRSGEWRPRRRGSIPGSDGRATTVLLSDHNRGRYLDDLISLAYTDGDRLDQMLARALSRGLLDEHFGGLPARAPALVRGSSYQTKRGGIAIFPFADADLTLTARVASLAPDRFDRGALRRYLSGVADDEGETRERRIIALHGLASLGEPVLLRVQDIAGGGDLTPRERVYAGLAAAVVGDDETASELYRGLLDEFGEYRGNMIRMNVGTTDDTKLEATSLVAILGATLGDDMAPLLYTFTQSRWTTDILIELEQISFLVQVLPRLSSDSVEFSYTHLGRRERARLDRGRTLVLRLTPAQLDALDLRVESGRLGVTSSFLAPFEPSAEEADPTIGISRTIQDQGGSDVTIDAGELVRIELSYTFTGDSDDACYQISDVLPSGLLPVSHPERWGRLDDAVDYPYAVDGQRVSFCAWDDLYQAPLVYYARAIGTGSYVAEPAVMQSQQTSESIAVTDEQRVVIR